MNNTIDKIDKVDKGDSLQDGVTTASTAEELHKHRVGPAPVSPLGWSISSRLLCALLASALLWLAVAWAIGWLK
jgi:hypothetical protein